MFVIYNKIWDWLFFLVTAKMWKRRISDNKKAIGQTFNSTGFCLFVKFTNMLILIQLVAKLLKWKTKRIIKSKE